jgi:hypothetical protein
MRKFVKEGIKGAIGRFVGIGSAALASIFAGVGNIIGAAISYLLSALGFYQEKKDAVKAVSESLGITFILYGINLLLSGNYIMGIFFIVVGFLSLIAEKLIKQ